ncbi:MAG: class D sortase [Anaerolineales bacterium]|jgi:sortase A
MARNRKPADELSIEELEALLARKKLEAREDRVRRFRRSGRAVNLQPEPNAGTSLDPYWIDFEDDELEDRSTFKRRAGTFLRFSLLIIELAALVALGFIVYKGYTTLQELNAQADASMQLSTPSPTPLITAIVLPSGHTPPNDPGGPRPNESEIPENLRPLVQSLASVPIPTPGPEQAQSLFIPALWNEPAPVVQGDGWEQLKRGVGQHIGSANPGERGNLVLSAHNDIYGERFRYLDRLNPGDDLLVTTATREYLYRVISISIVEPTDVSVMEATERRTITLISCYPYMVDDQRIVVAGELVEG